MSRIEQSGRLGVGGVRWRRRRFPSTIWRHARPSSLGSSAAQDIDRALSLGTPARIWSAAVNLLPDAFELIVRDVHNDKHGPQRAS